MSRFCAGHGAGGETNTDQGVGEGETCDWAHVETMLGTEIGLCKLARHALDVACGGGVSGGEGRRVTATGLLRRGRCLEERRE